MLEPWLGSGLSIDQLPVPRVIVARSSPAPRLDPGLRRAVTQVAPSASVDDHRAWIERMRSMTGATVLAGIGILVLVIAATIISVSFATRGAMAANRPIVEVLHFVGAGDRYIANHFLRHFLRLGLEGGVIGGGAAMLSSASRIDRRLVLGHPVGDQFAALLGRFRCRPRAIWRSRCRPWRSPPSPPGPRGERCSPRWTTSIEGPMAFCSEASHDLTPGLTHFA